MKAKLIKLEENVAQKGKTKAINIRSRYYQKNQCKKSKYN